MLHTLPAGFDKLTFSFSPIVIFFTQIDSTQSKTSQQGGYEINRIDS